MTPAQIDCPRCHKGHLRDIRPEKPVGYIRCRPCGTTFKLHAQLSEDGNCLLWLASVPNPAYAAAVKSDDVAQNLARIKELKDRGEPWYSEIYVVAQEELIQEGILDAKSDNP